MGLFDKFKRKDSDNKLGSMSYNAELECYVIEINNIIFVCEEEQDKEYINNLKSVADKYYDNFEKLIDFMLPDLTAMYGEIDRNSIKEKLGKPMIDYDNGTVKYLEQSFDSFHIFSFEVLDDDFNDLQYFSIDG